MADVGGGDFKVTGEDVDEIGAAFSLGGRHAVSTPGDLLFHIRAERLDIAFELATEIMAKLGGAVATADEVYGFRYFDDRDLLGFVDGTENPTDEAADDAALIRLTESCVFCRNAVPVLSPPDVTS